MITCEIYRDFIGYCIKWSRLLNILLGYVGLRTVK